MEGITALVSERPGEVVTSEAIVRRTAGGSRPARDQFWAGYQPQVTAQEAAWQHERRHGGDLPDRFELAAEYLANCPPVSHPSWCDPEGCEVEERRVVHHYRAIGSVPCPPAVADGVGAVITVSLERFDNLTDDGAKWEPNPEHPVVVHTELFDSLVAVDSLTLLSGPAAGRLGEVLTIAWRYVTGPRDWAYC